MTYSSKTIANYFLDLADAEGKSITPMKLQKLVYYANGWYAGHTGKPLINETVEAWQYGPVIESLYHEFKQYGSEPIVGRASELNWETLKEEIIPPPTDKQTLRFLDSIWTNYSKYTALTLSEMTHADGTPWSKTWDGVRGKDIPHQLIVEHFRIAIEKAKQKVSQAA